LNAAAGTGQELQIFGEDYATPDGTCVRDYIHVNDLAEAHVRALQMLLKGDSSLAANLGTGQGYSVRQILSAIEKATGRQVPHRIGPRRPGDPPALVANPALAERILGWRAQRGLDSIVQTAWKWQQNQAESMSGPGRSSRKGS
jgi:UDP-glucose 4-epimerase